MELIKLDNDHLGTKTARVSFPISFWRVSSQRRARGQGKSISSTKTSSTSRLLNRNKVESKSEGKKALFSRPGTTKRVRDNPPNEMSNRIHYLRICLHVMAASARKLSSWQPLVCFIYLLCLGFSSVCTFCFCFCSFMLVLGKMTKFFHFVLVLTFGETNFPCCVWTKFSSFFLYFNFFLLGKYGETRRAGLKFA